ncbi:MAG TPA: hypothetical protein VLH94_02045 [Spirochaetia bacterium]|nr:hypothetical protein [Spirochaetia bacterium]
MALLNMALQPIDLQHKQQIVAGTEGRDRGHLFEKTLAEMITDVNPSLINNGSFAISNKHLFTSNPALSLVSYICEFKKIFGIKKIKGYWLGGLATGKSGDFLVSKDVVVKKSKSDVLIDIVHSAGTLRVGVSVKTCNNKTPTNDQLFFTTASAFCELLRTNNIVVTQSAEKALKMFCGDMGFRPLDMVKDIANRKSDPNRWFYEELPEKDKKEFEKVFGENQNRITEVLLKKAYLGDPFPPDFLLHQTKSFTDIEQCEVALYQIDELINLSAKYKGFWVKSYFVRKGSYKGDPNEHFAPRFGIVQFQRGGQKQHPTQLQFNLESGYFYKISN